MLQLSQVVGHSAGVSENCLMGKTSTHLGTRSVEAKCSMRVVKKVHREETHSREELSFSLRGKDLLSF